MKLLQCSICVNRNLCLPLKEFPLLGIVGEKFINRDFLSFEEGDYIFKEGDDADGVFNLYSGRVEIVMKDGKKVITKTATDGDFMGFNSIIDAHYINSARATELSFICHFKSSEVEELIKEHQPISEKIITGY